MSAFGVSRNADSSVDEGLFAERFSSICRNPQDSPAQIKKLEQLLGDPKLESFPHAGNLKFLLHKQIAKLQPNLQSQYSHFISAICLDATDLECWMLLARVCISLNSPVVSLFCLSNARALSPQNPRIAALRKSLLLCCSGKAVLDAQVQHCFQDWWNQRLLCAQEPSAAPARQIQSRSVLKQLALFFLEMSLKSSTELVPEIPALELLAPESPPAEIEEDSMEVEAVEEVVEVLQQQSPAATSPLAKKTTEIKRRRSGRRVLAKQKQPDDFAPKTFDWGVFKNLFALLLSQELVAEADDFGPVCPSPVPESQENRGSIFHELHLRFGCPIPAFSCPIEVKEEPLLRQCAARILEQFPALPSFQCKLLLYVKRIAECVHGACGISEKVSGCLVPVLALMPCLDFMLEKWSMLPPLKGNIGCPHAGEGPLQWLVDWKLLVVEVLLSEMLVKDALSLAVSGPLKDRIHAILLSLSRLELSECACWRRRKIRIDWAMAMLASADRTSDFGCSGVLASIKEDEQLFLCHYNPAAYDMKLENGPPLPALNDCSVVNRTSVDHVHDASFRAKTASRLELTAKSSLVWQAQPPELHLASLMKLWKETVPAHYSSALHDLLYGNSSPCVLAMASGGGVERTKTRSLISPPVESMCGECNLCLMAWFANNCCATVHGVRNVVYAYASALLVSQAAAYLQGKGSVQKVLGCITVVAGKKWPGSGLLPELGRAFCDNIVSLAMAVVSRRSLDWKALFENCLRVLTVTSSNGLFVEAFRGIAELSSRAGMALRGSSGHLQVLGLTTVHLGKILKILPQQRECQGISVVLEPLWRHFCLHFGALKVAAPETADHLSGSLHCESAHRYKEVENGILFASLALLWVKTLDSDPADRKLSAVHLMRWMFAGSVLVKVHKQLCGPGKTANAVLSFASRGIFACISRLFAIGGSAVDSFSDGVAAMAPLMEGGSLPEDPVDAEWRAGLSDLQVAVEKEFLTEERPLYALSDLLSSLCCVKIHDGKGAEFLVEGLPKIPSEEAALLLLGMLFSFGKEWSSKEGAKGAVLDLLQKRWMVGDIGRRPCGAGAEEFVQSVLMEQSPIADHLRSLFTAQCEYLTKPTLNFKSDAQLSKAELRLKERSDVHARCCKYNPLTIANLQRLAKGLRLQLHVSLDERGFCQFDCQSEDDSPPGGSPSKRLKRGCTLCKTTAERRAKLLWVWLWAAEGALKNSATPLSGMLGDGNLPAFCLTVLPPSFTRCPEALQEHGPWMLWKKRSVGGAVDDSGVVSAIVDLVSEWLSFAKDLSPKFAFRNLRLYLASAGVLHSCLMNCGLLSPQYRSWLVKVGPKLFGHISEVCAAEIEWKAIPEGKAAALHPQMPVFPLVLWLGKCLKHIDDQDALDGWTAFLAGVPGALNGGVLAPLRVAQAEPSHWIAMIKYCLVSARLRLAPTMQQRDVEWLRQACESLLGGKAAKLPQPWSFRRHLLQIKCLSRLLQCPASLLVGVPLSPAPALKGPSEASQWVLSVLRPHIWKTSRKTTTLHLFSGFVKAASTSSLPGWFEEILSRSRYRDRLIDRLVQLYLISLEQSGDIDQAFAFFNLTHGTFKEKPAMNPPLLRWSCCALAVVFRMLSPGREVMLPAATATEPSAWPSVEPLQRGYSLLCSALELWRRVHGEYKSNPALRAVLGHWRAGAGREIEAALLGPLALGTAMKAVSVLVDDAKAVLLREGKKCSGALASGDVRRVVYACHERWEHYGGQGLFSRYNLHHG